jgi:DeoR family transcriptional regulator, suf operon transcriptional repressor
MTQSPPAEFSPTNYPQSSGLRWIVLLELKRTTRSTARELATRLKVSLNAVRHHLRDLEAQGLIVYERRNQGVGAPAYAYRLTPAGEAVFPRRYESTLIELLDHVVQREGRPAAVEALEGRYAALATRLQGELAGVTPGERMAAVVQLLTDEGYMAEASATSSTAVLIEHNCAIQAVAERFPEICAAEAKFLAAVLGAEVERQEHILSGCSACEYRVRFSPPTGTRQPIPEENV